MNFFIFWKISEGCIFASKGSSMSLNFITSYIRWKVCFHTFQKFQKNLKLDNFMHLGAFWLKTTAKTQNIRYVKNPQIPSRKLPNFKILKFFLYFYMLCITKQLIFNWHIVLIKQKLIFFFEILDIFPTFASQKIFW